MSEPFFYGQNHSSSLNKSTRVKVKRVDGKTNEKDKRQEKGLAGLDAFQWHLVFYATIGSALCFFLLNWVDSQAPHYYIIEYRSTAKFLFLVPATLNFLFLYVTFRKMKPTKSSSISQAPIISALIVSTTWIVGYLGFNFTVVHLVVPLLHIAVAAIVGFSLSLDYQCRYFDFKMPPKKALREYETKIKLFGDLLQALTLFFVSGGLIIMLSFTSDFGSVYLTPETAKPWIVGSAISLVYLAYGSYCIFLMRFMRASSDLSDHIAEKESELPYGCGGA